MAQYLMLLHSEPRPDGAFTPQEAQAITQKYMEWSQKMGAAGKLAGGNKLANDTGKVLRGADKVSVVDGPFAETKEVIGGYFILEARNYEEAAELSKSCPHLALGGTVELREIESM
jgi:hypothetical protein